MYWLKSQRSIVRFLLMLFVLALATPISWAQGGVGPITRDSAPKHNFGTPPH
jgi:hypothetical protein